ncbi:MAG: aspartate/glutamate racemase family protein [Candidatus Thorarchaeota archaeon]
MAKRIGILGGTSPESTAEYYLHITREYARRFGNFAYPEILIHSLSFQEIIDWQQKGHFDQIAKKMSKGLNTLHLAGADFGLIAAVTLHKYFNEISARVDMPLISIVEATKEIIVNNGHRRVGLLGTKTTMTEGFFIQSLVSEGIQILLPTENAIDSINFILYNEAAQGIITNESREVFKDTINSLDKRGVEAVILGCTEIPLFVNQADYQIPLYNATQIHADKALECALS